MVCESVPFRDISTFISLRGFFASFIVLTLPRGWQFYLSVDLRCWLAACRSAATVSAGTLLPAIRPDARRE